jgi:superfamily II DNA or RNA helicase
MKISIQASLTIEDAPPDLFGELRSRLTINNPKWAENEKMGRWNGDTEPFLYFWQKTRDGNLTIPRGYARQLIFLCRRRGFEYQLEDRRRTLPEVDFTFQGQLRDFQEKALADILAHDFGTLRAPTGAGKTIIALSAIAARRQPTLVIIHTKELLNQWIARIETFLQIPKTEIGVIGSGKQIIGDRITVALVQSLYKCAEDVAPYIGFLVTDECHRAPSRTFSEAVTAFDSRFMLGLSATPWRRDKLTRLIYWFLGDLVHEVDTTALQEAGHILKAKVIWKDTDYQTDLDPSEQYSRMLSELTQDHERNMLISRDVIREAQNGGGTCLVLSDRKEHAATLRNLLTGQGIDAAVLTGETPRKEREAIVERLNAGGIKVLCATGQLIGEGFDCKDLSTLFLGTPIKFDGRVLQYIGRILRPAPGKETATVYDYRDQHIGPLVAAARARARTYRQNGATE